ncbi:MAG: hypothetical protein EPO65_02050 [Dehalococcoidia bacterium]|nr:MAG: hypothetical protein EPO65_02050 [Dehalococcoidia bacterium]
MRRVRRPSLLPAWWQIVAALVVVACAALAGAPARAGAQEPPTFAPKTAPKSLTTIEDLGIGDTAANGARVSKEFFFSGAGDYELGNNNKIFVDITHSNLLDAQRSVMNVVLNNRPLLSIRLDQNNVDFGHYEINVPKDLVSKDFNRLTFEFGMTTGLLCEDPFSPALFTNILRTTAFQIDFASNPPVPRIGPPNLAEYPYPFFRAGYPVVAPVLIAIPDEPNEVELTGAYRLSADLATRVLFDLELLQVRPVSSITPDELRNQQLILIGTPQRNSLVARALTNTPFRMQGNQMIRDQQQVLDPAFGVLALTSSPFNGNLRALLATGAEDQAVKRAVDAITSAEPAALLAGPTGVLTEPVQPPASRSFQSIFTFKDAGAREQTLLGGGTQISTLVFSSPAPAPGANGKLDLIISHPDIIDRRRSNIVVELNGQAIQTIKVNKEQTRRVSYQVNLFSDVLKVGPNTLTLRTTLYDPEPLVLEACESTASERFFITIHEDSAISLPQAAGTSSGSDLASLPFPFAGLLGLRETTFIVNEKDNDSLRAGMLATIALGRRFGAQNDFTVVPASTSTPQSVGDRHVVAINVPRETQIGQQLEKVLPLILRPDGTRALVEEKGTLAEILDSSRVGALQLAQVPWATSRRLLAVTGTDNVALGWAAEALPKGGLVGNVALFQSAKQVNTFSLKRLADVDENSLKNRFTNAEARQATLLAVFLITLGAIALMVLWSFRNRLAPRTVGLPRLPYRRRGGSKRR